MAAEILDILIKTNLAGAAAILLVLAARKSLRTAFGARLSYALWLVVPLVVGASLIPARKIVIASPAQPLLEMEPASFAVMPMESAQVSAAPDTGTLVLGLWLTGLIASGLLLIWRQNRFMASLGGVRMEGGYLRAKASDAGPMVVGALRPRLILPADFEARFDARERDVVLAHERAHLRAGDTRINGLVALVQCAAWFNPLVHVAARYLRLDQELACDAAVLATRPNDRLLYATALLKAQTHNTPLPLGCYWPAGAHPLKERILMLKSQSPSRLRAFAGSIIVAGLGAGAGAAAWAAQPAQIMLEPQAVTAATAVQAEIAGPVQLAQADGQGAAALPPRPTQITPRPPMVSPPVATPTGASANSIETPASLVAKVASAKTKDDCLMLFPYLSTGTNAEKTQRINEQVTCLNRWNPATPSLLRQFMSSQPGGANIALPLNGYRYTQKSVSFVVATSDGKQTLVELPLASPSPVATPIANADAGRARRILTAAGEAQAARVTSGAPTQPWSPEADAAIKVLIDIGREAQRVRFGSVLPALNDRIAQEPNGEFRDALLKRREELVKLSTSG